MMELLDQFLCPITGQIMQNPVVIDDGHTFQRQAIIHWFSKGHWTNPVTNLRLKNLDVRPNYALKAIINKYQERINQNNQNIVAQITKQYVNKQTSKNKFQKWQAKFQKLSQKPIYQESNKKELQLNSNGWFVQQNPQNYFANTRNNNEWADEGSWENWGRSSNADYSRNQENNDRNKSNPWKWRRG